MHSLLKKTEKLVKAACFLKQGCVKEAEAAGWVSPAAEFGQGVPLALRCVKLST
jgi:hypothetical protein